MARRPNPEEIALFTQELGWMVDAGVPLGRAFDLMAREATGALQPVIAGVRGALRAGQPLAEAMRGQGAFPEPYLRLIALGEATGTLPGVLERLHDGLSRARALRRKVASALVYPVFLLAVALAASALILLAVVPQLRAVLPTAPRADGSDAAIRRLIGLSDALAAHGALWGLGVVALGALAVALLRRAEVRAALARGSRHLPVLGPLLREARLAAMTRSLAMLTQSGLPLSEALALTAQSLEGDLAALSRAMETALRAGQDVTGPLAEAKAPPLLLGLIRVGQETGDMGRALGQAADVFEDRTRRALDRALVLLEPLIILAISVGVGGLIYTVIGALMSVNDLFV